ncbi:FadR/GntR family transcriptional regulator [Paenibacillus thermotolerans]|uniref:FadR/GntR family transcriptional regulator n=1 Tax=Paenibacillus thermotolerans TaxID=3027807 RepID=UPI002368C147|nr:MULTISPECIES: FadR/GntR family transcriptional regulator [unclassified Paenibacillus]
MNHKRPSLVEIVHDRIKDYIVDRRLKPGDRLPSEKEMIEVLGVSRAVVREALKSLQMMGIVDIKPGQGIVVGELSVKPVFEQIAFQWKVDGKKFKELLDTRCVLELGAIDLAIEHYDPTAIEAIEHWNQVLLDKIRRQERPEREDLQFHHALFEATGNHTYSQLSQVVHEYFSRSRLDKINDIDAYETAYEQHSLILHWIKKKDAPRAKQCMVEHLQPLYEYLK